SLDCSCRFCVFFFFFSSRRRHTRFSRDWSSDVCSSDLSYLVKKNIIHSPKTFVNTVPHMSFVWGDSNVNFLKKRHEALVKQPLFEAMEFSEDPEVIKKWAPLIIEGRDHKEKIAATHMNLGTDVNFGELTRRMIKHQVSQEGVTVSFNTEVYNLKRTQDGRWTVFIKNVKTGEKRTITTKFVFIGAG